MKDLQGRRYARLDELKPGMKVQVDGDFDCIEAWSIKEIKIDEKGSLWVECEEGEHHIIGQLNNGWLVGVYHYMSK
jgi:hypothetical protein